MSQRWQNQPNDMCAQRRLRSPWASARWISVFVVRFIDSLGLKLSSGGQWRVTDALADLSFCCVHRPFCWFCYAPPQIGVVPQLSINPVYLTLSPFLNANFDVTDVQRRWLSRSPLHSPLSFIHCFLRFKKDNFPLGGAGPLKLRPGKCASFISFKTRLLVIKYVIFNRKFNETFLFDFSLTVQQVPSRLWLKYAFRQFYTWFVKMISFMPCVA